MTHSPRAKTAFTLMEMILAMAMVAMLAGSLFMSLTIAFKARESAQAAVAPMRSAAITMDLIRQDFESVPPPGPAEDPVALAGPFIALPQSGGGRDGALLSSVQFHTISRDHLPAAVINPLAEGIRLVELGVRSEAGTNVLVRRVSRNLLAPSLPEPQEEILCRGVRSFTLRFYDGVSWHEEWDSTQLGDVLPMAVEVTLEIDKPASQTASPWFTDAQANAYRVVRIFPLPCAKPIDTSQAGGIMQ